MNWLVVDEIIKNALLEDIPDEDITTNCTIDKYSNSTVDLIAKEEGVIAGTEVFKRVFEILGDVTVKFNVVDGEKVLVGQVIAKIQGNTRKILSGERTALNLMQRMCGVATLTAEFVKRLQGTGSKLLDTRKTTPNLRILEKYSVKIGGGCNHRYNLSDGVLLKDNHISAAGGIKQAIEAARKNVSFVRKIEVEVESIDEVYEAIGAGADIIMLDNMDVECMKQAVKIINGRAITEASGNVDLNNIRDVALSGVDFISTGAVTHSYKILDLSMKNLRVI